MHILTFENNWLVHTKKKSKKINCIVVRNILKVHYIFISIVIHVTVYVYI